MRSDRRRRRRQETPLTAAGASSASGDASHGGGIRWPRLVVGAAPLILFWPIVFGGKVMFWGLPLLQFYPWRNLVRRALLAGRLPLWNELLGNGAPLLANYQSAVFYPPNWLDLVLPLDYSIGLTTALHYVWAGLGMVALARALGLSRFGQAVAGLAFGLSGYFVARLSFISIISAAAWLPWMIWATESGVTEWGIKGSGIRAIRYWWALTLCAAMQLLAGHAQTAFYSWLLAAAWAVARSRTAMRPTPRPSAARCWSLSIDRWSSAIRHAQRPFAILLALAASLALAAALAAGQLLPTFELMRASQRASGADYDFVMTYSLWPWRLITLLAPDFFGNPADGNYWGYGNYWEDAAYLGVLPLGLAGLAGAAWAAERRKVEPSRADNPSRSLPPFLFGVALASILLALGKNTPVFPFLYRHVPPFNQFQAPARALIGYVFAVSLLAGIGAQAWRRPKGRALYWTRLGVAGAAAIGLAAGLAALTLEVKSTFLGAAGLLSVWAAGSFILSLLKPEAEPSAGRHGPARWQAACLGFIALDLAVAGYRLNPYLPPAVYRNTTASGGVLHEFLDGHRLFWFAGDEYRARFERWFRFETFGPAEADYWLGVRESQLANLNVLDGIASANNFDPLVPARYFTLLAALETAPPEAAGRILRAMDVRLVIGARSSDEWEIAYRGEGWDAYAVPGASSRARVVYSAQATPDEAAALAAVFDSSFDPDAMVVLEVGGVNSEPQVQFQRDFQSQPARLLTNSPEEITISASLSRDGWVVLADTYYPGWRAYVDGREAAILPANYAFRAVAVPAGEHTVEFRYQPQTLRLGLSVSVIAWLTAITVGIAVRRRA